MQSHWQSISSLALSGRAVRILGKHRATQTTEQKLIDTSRVWEMFFAFYVKRLSLLGITSYSWLTPVCLRPKSLTLAGKHVSNFIIMGVDTSRAYSSAAHVRYSAYLSVRTLSTSSQLMNMPDVRVYVAVYAGEEWRSVCLRRYGASSRSPLIHCRFVPQALCQTDRPAVIRIKPRLLAMIPIWMSVNVSFSVSRCG